MVRLMRLASRAKPLSRLTDGPAVIVRHSHCIVWMRHHRGVRNNQLGMWK